MDLHKPQSSNIPIKKSNGVKSGDHAGQETMPLVSIHRFGNILFKSCRTTIALWAGAPSCWKNIHSRVSNDTSSSSLGSLLVKKLRFSIEPSYKF